MFGNNYPTARHSLRVKCPNSDHSLIPVKIISFLLKLLEQYVSVVSPIYYLSPVCLLCKVRPANPFARRARNDVTGIREGSELGHFTLLEPRFLATMKACMNLSMGVMPLNIICEE